MEDDCSEDDFLFYKQRLMDKDTDKPDKIGNESASKSDAASCETRYNVNTEELMDILDEKEFETPREQCKSFDEEAGVQFEARDDRPDDLESDRDSAEELDDEDCNIEDLIGLFSESDDNCKEDIGAEINSEELNDEMLADFAVKAENQKKDPGTNKIPRKEGSPANPPVEIKMESAFGIKKPRDLSRKRVEADDFLETKSKLRIKNPRVSRGQLASFLRDDREYIPLARFSKINPTQRVKLVEDRNWATAAVVMTKSDTSRSTKNHKYIKLRVTDLQTPHASEAYVFLYDAVYEKYWNDVDFGSVVFLFNPKISENLNCGKNGRYPFFINVSELSEFFIAGRSVDLDICKSTRLDGNPCRNIVNRSICEYCANHAQKELRKTTTIRAELQGPAPKPQYTKTPATVGNLDADSTSHTRKKKAQPPSFVSPGPKTSSGATSTHMTQGEKFLSKISDASLGQHSTNSSKGRPAQQPHRPRSDSSTSSARPSGSGKQKPPPVGGGSGRASSAAAVGHSIQRSLERSIAPSSTSTRAAQQHSARIDLHSQGSRGSSFSGSAYSASAAGGRSRASAPSGSGKPDVEKRIRSLQETIATLHGQVADLKAEKRKLLSTNMSLTDEVSRLNRRVEELERRSSSHSSSENEGRGSSPSTHMSENGKMECETPSDKMPHNNQLEAKPCSPFGADGRRSPDPEAAERVKRQSNPLSDAKAPGSPPRAPLKRKSVDSQGHGSGQGDEAYATPGKKARTIGPQTENTTNHAKDPPPMPSNAVAHTSASTSSEARPRPSIDESKVTESEAKRKQHPQHAMEEATECESRAWKAKKPMNDKTAIREDKSQDTSGNCDGNTVCSSSSSSRAKIESSNEEVECRSRSNSCTSTSTGSTERTKRSSSHGSSSKAKAEGAKLTSSGLTRSHFSVMLDEIDGQGEVKITYEDAPCAAGGPSAFNTTAPTTGASAQRKPTEEADDLEKRMRSMMGDVKNEMLSRGFMSLQETALREEDFEKESMRLERIAKREGIMDFLSAITQRKVKVHWCPVCQVKTKQRRELCTEAGHDVVMMDATEYFFACRKCNNRHSEFNNQISVSNCQKCGNATFYRTSVCRLSGGGGSLIPKMAPRGEEHARSIAGDYMRPG